MCFNLNYSHQHILHGSVKQNKKYILELLFPKLTISSVRTGNMPFIFVFSFLPTIMNSIEYIVGIGKCIDG